MADGPGQARRAEQGAEGGRQELERELWDRDRKISHLSRSKEDLAEQVHHLKALVKDAHTRYEDDLQLTVASLQDQYNAAVELLQVGAGLNATTAGPKSYHSSGAPPPLTSWARAGSGSAAQFPAQPRAPGAHQPPPCQAQPQSHPHHNSQPHRQCCGGSGACRCRQAAPHSHQAPYPTASSSATAGGAKGAASQRPKAAGTDPRFGLLGLDPDDFGPSAAFGASVGLVTEPLAVLRDILNLDGAQDREREQMIMTGRPSASAGGVAGIHGNMLAQAQFETRLRGAYRSMLLQLQHRYQLERERQEDTHKLELQDQEERHSQVVRELTERHQAEMQEAAGRLDQEAAARRADVQRLEAHLGAAKAAAETSQSQAAAARAAAEALQAQMQLQRTTHEAELQHIRQGSIPVRQHEEVMQRLKSEWDSALQQRERDFGALLTELAGLRRQLSSVAEASRSSGHSCGHGAASVSRPASAAAAAAEQQSATAAAAADATAAADPQASCSSSGRKAGCQDAHSQPRREPAAMRAAGQSPERRHDALDTTLPGGPGPARGMASGGGIGVPVSPAGSGYSVALSVDERGSAILEVSEDTAATPHSRAYPLPLQGADLSRPPSAASSRLSDLVNAIVYGDSPRGGSTAGHETRNGVGRGGDGTMRGDNGGAEPGPSADPAEGLSGTGDRGGPSSGRGHGSFGGWLPQEDCGWPAGSSAPAADPGGGGGTQRPGSAEQHSSEVTFDRWRADEPPNQPGYTNQPGRRSQGRSRTAGSCGVGSGCGGEEGRAAGLRSRSPSPSPPAQGRSHSPYRQPQWQQARTAALVPGASAKGDGTGVLPGSRAGSPTSPLRAAAGGVGGGHGGSGAYGLRSRHSLMAADAPRCLRCGLNDDTSPGICRFHPALLANPGSFRFTPEWMTCHAADHTARIPGCFVRSEHFYDPSTAAAVMAGKQRRVAPAGGGGQAAAGPEVTATCGGARHAAMSAAGPCHTGSPRAGTGAEAAVGQRAGGQGLRGAGETRGASEAAPATAGQGGESGARRVAWGSVSYSPPRPGLTHQRAAAAAGPPSAAYARADGGKVYMAPRVRVSSPGRTAPAGAAASRSGESSPSPKPRTRLPSPLRR